MGYRNLQPLTVSAMTISKEIIPTEKGVSVNDPKQQAKRYVGSLTAGALLREETKILAPYLLQNLTLSEWKTLFIRDNPLQKNSEQTSLRYMRTIRSRLASVGDDQEAFLQDLVMADYETFSQLMLLLVMLSSPIVVDFMRNALYEAKRCFEEQLSDDVWEQFINERRYSLPILAEYSESTLRKVGNTVLKLLVEAGYLNNTREKRLLSVYPTALFCSWLHRLEKEDWGEFVGCIQ